MSMNEYTQNRWHLTENGSITWDIEQDTRLPHTDYLEMSGMRVSLIVKYGIKFDGSLELSQNVVLPTLRTIPNNTHGTLIKEYDTQLLPSIRINGVLAPPERPYYIEFNGILTIKSYLGQQADLTRRIFPSTDHPTAIHEVTLKNNSSELMNIAIDYMDSASTARGVYGIYILDVKHAGNSTAVLEPGETMTFGLTFHGRKLYEELQEVDIAEEEDKRMKFLHHVTDSLILETPIPLLNQAFDFAKIRASESVFQTKNGLLHSPGGFSYYAAVWTNDQAEYAGPFFPFLGEAHSVEASINCYRLYRPFMGPDYLPIPSSIIAEGIDIWEGAGDRGDAAMYAYGAARFALALGDKAIGKELFPAIEWCLEYCRRMTTEHGVISSDSDELEGRFPSGTANLATSSLTYGALRSAATMARELGYPDKAVEYSTRADMLVDAIETYFGANVEGYDTYRYYDGNEVLRSWICLPLTMGIMKRKEGTLAALFSPRLWTEDGLSTQAGDITFWDRSTLYGFRAAFAAGETENAMDYFIAYTQRRTLGDHVPYAVEAYPEGNQKHLSAESALYCRTITEGLFGITPTGFHSFSCSPNLPHQWNSMSLRSIQAFDHTFDLHIISNEDANEIVVVTNDSQRKVYPFQPGETVQISLE